MKMRKLFIAALFILTIACNRKPDKGWIEQHNEYNDHWSIGTDAGFVLRAAYVDTTGNAWAISASGIILYKPQGGKWVREQLPVTNRRLYSITGRGNEVWVTGEEGLILFKQDKQPWVQQKQKAGLIDLNSVYVAGNDIYIVGSGGVILCKKDTAGWKEEKCPDEQAILTAIKGTPGNLYIVGDAGIILHKAANGNWIKEDIGKINSNLTDLFVQDNKVWVTGENGIILHKSANTKWVIEKTPAGKSRIDNIYGFGDQLWALAQNGNVLYKKGNEEWRNDKKHPLNGYFMGGYSNGHDIWLAGSHNVILHKHENEPWVQENTPASPEILVAIAGNGRHLVAAGFNESILERNAGGQWTTANEMITNAHLTGIYALNDEAWVSDNKGNILYKNMDNNWQKEASGLSTLEIKDGYRYGDDVWLIGKPAVILHKHGNGPWRNETPPVDKTSELHSIYGRDSAIWVAGTNNILFHKKSGTQKWVNDYQGKSSHHFFAVTAIGDELYALGSSLTILHKKITDPDWVQETINSEEVRDVREGHFHAIVKTDSTLYAVGGHGLLLSKKDNGNWVREDLDVKGIDLKDMTVMDGTVYAIGNIGERGVIIYKHAGTGWVKQEKPWTNFLKIINYRGLCLITKSGYLYKKNNTQNFLSKGVVSSISSVVSAAVCSGQLYFAAKNSIVKLVPDQRQYPTVTEVRYFTSSLFNPDSLEVQFTLQSPPKERYKDLRQMRVEMLARTYNGWQQAKEVYQPVVGTSRLIDSGSNSFTFAFRFEIANNFRITPASDLANKLEVKIHVTSITEGVTEEITLKDKDGNPFLTVNNDEWNNNKEKVFAVAIGLFIILMFIAIWFIKPVWYLKFYRPEFYKRLAALNTPFKQLFLIFELLPFRWLAHKPRVLDAWIRANNKILANQFLENKTVAAKSPYVSLPVSMSDKENGKVNEPDVRFCASLFSPERTVVQLVGQGGAGKTMLAVAMGRWMLQPQRFGKKKNLIRVPVFIESDTTNLLQTIKEFFHGWFGTPVDEGFLMALLKTQRLVVMVDAFSERSAETQAHIKNIHAALPVNALFITTRQEVKMNVPDMHRLQPADFSPEVLVHFITHLLDERKDQPLTKYHDQINFAKVILGITKKQGKYTGITPMLVKMIVDNVLSKVTATTPVEEIFAAIPDLIPQVFYDYLCNTHPESALTLQQIITVTEDMALLSLNDDFIPRDFKEEDILPALLADPHFRNNNPIDRLVENGIIARRNNKFGVFYLRFNLDTMAEYLGASRLYDKHRDDPQQLNALIEKVTRLGDEAAGFKIAFEHIKEYKMKNG